jgi:putative acetyltransferase
MMVKNESRNHENNLNSLASPRNFDVRPMTIREFRNADGEALADVFRDAVLGTGPQGYTAIQVQAWARVADDSLGFSSRLAEGYTLVAEIDGVAAAFGQLHPIDHIAMIYCRSSHSRRGLSSAIVVRLEQMARPKGVDKITTEASVISRPFFAKLGFSVTEIERVIRFEAEFKRYKMQKLLDGKPVVTG